MLSVFCHGRTRTSADKEKTGLGPADTEGGDRFESVRCSAPIQQAAKGSYPAGV